MPNQYGAEDYKRRNDAILMRGSQKISQGFNPAQQRMVQDYAKVLQSPEYGLQPGEANLRAAGSVFRTGNAYSNYKLPPQQPQERQTASLLQPAAQQQTAAQQQPAGGMLPLTQQATESLHPSLRSGYQPVQQQPLTDTLRASMMSATGPYQGRQAFSDSYAQRPVFNSTAALPQAQQQQGINFAPQGYGSAASAPKEGTKAWYDSMGPGQKELLFAMQKLSRMPTNPMDGPSSLVPNKEGGYDRVVTGLAEQMALVDKLSGAGGSMGNLRGRQLPNEAINNRTAAGERTAVLQADVEKGETNQLGRAADLQYALGQDELAQEFDRTQMTHARNIAAQKWAQSKDNPANRAKASLPTIDVGGNKIPMNIYQDPEAFANYLSALGKIEHITNPPLSGLE